MNINELIEKRAQLKQEQDELNRQLKELRAEQDEIDVQLLQKMDAEGLSRTANERASVSINEETVPDVTDWDAVYDHVVATKDFSLMHRRISSTAYRELLKLGQGVPGLAPRIVRKINFRSL